jgi:hypothetical protein
MGNHSARKTVGCVTEQGVSVQGTHLLMYRTGNHPARHEVCYVTEQEVTLHVCYVTVQEVTVTSFIIRVVNHKRFLLPNAVCIFWPN